MERFSRGRKRTRDTKSDLTRDTQSERREPNTLRMLIRDRERELRSQSLPPNFKSSRYERKYQRDFLNRRNESHNMLWQKKIQERRVPIETTEVQNEKDISTIPFRVFSIESSQQALFARKTTISRQESYLGDLLSKRIGNLERRIKTFPVQHKEYESLCKYIKREKENLDVLSDNMAQIEHLVDANQLYINLRPLLRFRQAFDSYRKNMKKRNYVQICIDFGLAFDPPNLEVQNKVSEKINARTKTVNDALCRCIENPLRINALPLLEKWNDFIQYEIRREWTQVRFIRAKL